jgi:two-component system cell cycle response regulator
MTDGRDDAARVVVVDDDRLIRELVHDAICNQAQVECCDSAESAIEALRREPAALVISDLSMPGLSGIELLDEVRRTHPDTEFVLLTGNATVESAVDALRMGVADYLTKPIRSDELGLVVERILARRRLLAENRKLRDTLRTVDSCQNLMRCLEPGEVYAIALDLLLQNLPRHRGLALFHRGSIPISDGIVCRGFSERDARVLREVLIDEKPLDLESITQVEVTAEGLIQNTLRGVGIECGSIVTVPIRGGNEQAGTLWLFDDGRPFDSNEIDQAKLIAGHADLALRNAERYNQAKERAFIDDVTEVYNARYLLAATDREIHRAERYNQTLSALFLDLDRFKLVNDRHGHLVGSRALRRLSEVLLTCIRQVDTLARYGGDEFTILLVDTDHATALKIAERIRSKVAETQFEAGRESPFRVSISIGVATLPTHAGDRNGLLDAADKAMYRAKSLGRNCVCSAADL